MWDLPLILYIIVFIFTIEGLNELYHIIFDKRVTKQNAKRKPTNIKS